MLVYFIWQWLFDTRTPLPPVHTVKDRNFLEELSNSKWQLEIFWIRRAGSRPLTVGIVVCVLYRYQNYAIYTYPFRHQNKKKHFAHSVVDCCSVFNVRHYMDVLYKKSKILPVFTINKTKNFSVLRALSNLNVRQKSDNQSSLVNFESRLRRITVSNCQTLPSLSWDRRLFIKDFGRISYHRQAGPLYVQNLWQRPAAPLLSFSSKLQTFTVHTENMLYHVNVQYDGLFRSQLSR